MFFNNLKNESLKDHERVSKEMNDAFTKVKMSSDEISRNRELACELIEEIEIYINHMTRTPKSIDRKLGEINVEVSVFKKTEEYAQASYDAAVESGIIVAAGAVPGMGMIVVSSSEWKNLTSTFGRKNADNVIETVSNCKDAAASIDGAVIGKISSIKKTIHNNLGKIGIGLTAASLATGIGYITYSNYNISNQLIEETAEINKEISHLNKKNAEIIAINKKITSLISDLKKNSYRLKVISEKYVDYMTLGKQSRKFLMSYINNTYSLAELLNEDIK